MLWYWQCSRTSNPPKQTSPPSAIRFAISYCFSKQQERFGLFVSSLVDEMTRSGKIKRNEEEIKALGRNGSEQGM